METGSGSVASNHKQEQFPYSEFVFEFRYLFSVFSFSFFFFNFFVLPIAISFFHSLLLHFMTCFCDLHFIICFIVFQFVVLWILDFLLSIHATVTLRQNAFILFGLPLVFHSFLLFPSLTQHRPTWPSAQPALFLWSKNSLTALHFVVVWGLCLLCSWPSFTQPAALGNISQLLCHHSANSKCVIQPLCALYKKSLNFFVNPICEISSTLNAPHVYKKRFDSKKHLYFPNWENCIVESKCFPVPFAFWGPIYIITLNTWPPNKKTKNKVMYCYQ